MITSVRPQGTNVLVVASIPSGIRRVLLESRSRLDSGAWAPVAVRSLDGTPQTISFLVATSAETEMLRIRADAATPLPLSFYGGGKEFWGGAAENSPGFADLDAAGPGSREGTRDVVESDIWRISGDRLYFFNQYRGLQIIDISDPDKAVVQGTLPLPSSGEQMYLLETNHAVLLARDSCWSYTDGGQVLVVAVTNEAPALIKRLSVPGYTQESRMVGSALYVASQSYRQVLNTTNSTWEWGTTVSSFDLGDPANPVVRDSFWFSGYGNVVQATDTFLFVVTQNPTNWWQSTVNILDISSPDGRMAVYTNVETAGQVKDKFKMNYADGIFTTIAEDWRRPNNAPLVTVLETWRLPDPRSAGPLPVARLGRLELGRGERLHATRFDGARVYVVTFFQIDPLWIVDLSDPANPRIAGELEVPGWSTYIEPLGSKLVSVGVETNRVAVSLFEVADPSKPALLDRVLLGISHSYTEANWDEKAFSVLEDAGMILVPYSGDTSNGWSSQVQIIDLNDTRLTARGTIQHALQPRRATFSHNRVLSLSGQELLSVDVTDRDAPLVRGDLALSWPVDELLLHGAYLLQFTESSSWWGEPQPAIRVSLADRPNDLLHEVKLGQLPITGAAIAGDRLYVVQNELAYSVPADTNNVPRTNFTLTVFDLSELPLVESVARVEVAATLNGWTTSWKAFWPRPDTLVWVGGGDSYWYPFLDWRWGISDVRFFRPWPGRSAGGGHLMAFEVSNPAEPKLVSELNLRTNNWYGFSPAFQHGSLLYFSHATSEPVVLADQKTTNYVARNYLDVVDYADPTSPALRKPVNIPGLLEGITHAGELLYTRGTHWTTNQTDWREYLDASAYNGVEANLVASLPLSQNWPHPVLVAGTNIVVGKANYESGTTPPDHSVQAWFLDVTGRFIPGASLKVDSPASSFWHKEGLLAVQNSETQVLLFDFSGGSFLPLGKAQPSGCIWFDITRSEGDLARGLWVPLGDYGATRVPVE